MDPQEALDTFLEFLATHGNTVTLQNGAGTITALITEDWNSLQRYFGETLLSQPMEGRKAVFHVKVEDYALIPKGTSVTFGGVKWTVNATREEVYADLVICYHLLCIAGGLPN